VLIVRQQRHVGTIPHAPGARLPRPGWLGDEPSNPDFAAVGALSFGAGRIHCHEDGDFLPVLKRALGSPVLSLIELSSIPRAIAPPADVV